MLQNPWGKKQPKFAQKLDNMMEKVLQSAGDLAIIGRRFKWWGSKERRALPGQNPVLLVHGYGADLGSLQFISRLLQEDGWNVYHANLDTVHYTVEELGDQLADQVEDILEQLEQPRIDILGHSLGGIIARYYIQVLGGNAWVDRLITVGTPHTNGTWASYFVYPLRALGLYPIPDDARSIRQLLPSSGLYERLNSHVYNVGMCRLVDVTSVWSLTDELVLPATNAYFPYGRNKIFLAKGHIQLLVSPAVYKYCKTRLLSPPEPPGLADNWDVIVDFETEPEPIK